MTPAVRVPLALPPLPARPLVSVLVPSYNYARYVGAALESLQAQTYPYWEAVVCDDGSTDDSRAVIARYVRQDERIRLLEQPNGGVASALNAAFRACRGEVVCLLDADDTFAPNKLAQVVEGFRHHDGSGLLMHAMQVVDAAGQPRHRIPFGDVFEEGWLAEAVRRRGGRWRAMPASALCLRRPVADLLFPIPEATFRSEADGFLVTLAPLLTRVAGLPEVLATYRLHGANLTGAGRLDRAVAVRHLDALHRIEEAVNARLRALLPGSPPLRTSSNVNLHEHTLALALFDGAPMGTLLRLYGRLARVLLADDLYRAPRKALGLFAFKIALLVPVGWRADWLTRALGVPRLRAWLGRLRGGAAETA